MTNNIDRAAEVLGKVRYERSRVATPDMIEWFARDAYREVHALADAGLLAPDPPSPDRDGRWWPTAASIGNVNINPAGEIVLHSGNFRDMTLHLAPAKARDLANILNAAADHAEEASHAQDD